MLYSEKRDISSDEQKAIYIDFWIRNPQLNKIKQLIHAKSINYNKLNEVVNQLSPNDINEDILEKIKKFQKEYFTKPYNKKIREISIFILKDALKADPYFNALRIKFGYAVTCYKAQGGEWKNTFLNCKTSMGYFNSSYFRWLYTGITRAKENLFIIDEPHFTIGSNLQPPKIKNIAPRKDLLVLHTEITEFEIPFDFSNELPFVKHIFLAINDSLKDENMMINNIKHSSYLEHYTFLRENESATFRIHYSGQNKITTIEKPGNTSEFIENIFTKLQQIQNKVIVVADQETEQSETTFEFEQPFLKEFYENIKSKLASSNFQISKIEHKRYHEIYEFKKSGFVATYKFHYNGRKIFKKTEIIENRTTGLIDELNSLIN